LGVRITKRILGGKETMRATKRIVKTDRREYVLPRHYEALGAYLQEMRIRARLTQREVSLALGYSSAQFIANFERGLATPPLKKMRELIHMYRMPVEKVMQLILDQQKEELGAALRSQGPRNPLKRA
jgi:DNA-binding XRE family transcriptional regulator